MTLSCLHTHTVFCDGDTDMETMCEAAFSKGFSSIGFSSHAPITKKTGLVTDWHMKDEKLDEYIDAVLLARKHWQGRLNVFLGLEVDYFEGLFGPHDPDIQALPLDYIIGTVHYAVSPKKEGFYKVDVWPEEFNSIVELFDNDGRMFCESYFEAYNGMIRAGGYDILGHLDIQKKCNELYKFFSDDESWYKEILLGTADLIAGVRCEAEKSGGRIPVAEVNTGAMIRGYTSEPYPSLYMQKLLAERNVPLVLTADAHRPDYLGGHYETGWKLMRQAGYSTTVFFEGRKNGKAIWREEPLSAI